MFENSVKKIFRNHSAKMLFSYFLCAGVATLADFGFLYLLTDVFKVWYWYSAAISYFIGMIVNYSLNKYFTFKNTDKRVVKQFGKFVIIATGGLLLNQLTLFIAVEFFHVWYLLAKALATLLIAYYSFYGHKKFTFKEQ